MMSGRRYPPKRITGDDLRRSGRWLPPVRKLHGRRLRRIFWYWFDPCRRLLARPGDIGVKTMRAVYVAQGLRGMITFGELLNQDRGPKAER